MSKPTKSRRRQKSPEHNWEIVGEKDNDEFDIRYLREVDFSEVEQLDPSRGARGQSGYNRRTRGGGNGDSESTGSRFGTKRGRRMCLNCGDMHTERNVRTRMSRVTTVLFL